MDNLDRKIIQELSEDARKPFMAIAKKLGTSTQTVIRRYNEMKANGTIGHSAITIDLEKIGYHGTAHMLINIKLEANSAEIVEQLKKTQNVIIATRTTGSYEAYAVLVFRDIDDLFRNVSKIKALPNIRKVDVFFAVPGIKQFPLRTKQFDACENSATT
jgi:Lrp/AsnC family transcriptional regulator for asnA, asnC and gidA